MFNVTEIAPHEMKLSGRLDAMEVENAKPIFEKMTASTTLDCQDLAYISSAGLGLLISTQMRLAKGGFTLKLTKVAKFVRDVLRFSGLDKIFQIEE